MFYACRIAIPIVIRLEPFSVYREVTSKLPAEQTVRRLTHYDAAPGERKAKLVFNEAKTDSDTEVF